MTFKVRGNRLGAILLLLFLTVFNVKATDVQFNMTDVFGIVGPPATNRVVRIQSLSPFAGNYFWATSDVAGNLYVSNALATTYSGTVLAPPNSIQFSFFVSATNLGTIPATGITSIPANMVGTFPAGQTAYSAQASDNRYAPKGSSPFSALTAAQSTNLVQGSTNGMTSIVYSNSMFFANTNLVYVTSNALAAQINSGGISALNATNMANSLTGVIATNGAPLTYKFTSSGTNAIQSLAQTIADTSSNSVLVNAQTAINTSSNSVLANAQTAINASSNSVLSTAQTRINNSSNSLFSTTQTAINTSSNSVLANAQTAINASSNSVLSTAQTRINNSSNSLSGLIAVKADTNGPTIWSPLFVGPVVSDGSIFFDTNNAVTNVYGGLLSILGTSVQSGSGTTASGAQSHTEGESTTASGADSHAEGNGTTASGGFGSHAEGFSTTASASESHAEGFSTTASGQASHAEGLGTVASGTGSHAAGQNANATNNNSFVWSDSTTIGSGTNKTFTVNANNGIRLLGGAITGNGNGITNIPVASLSTNGSSQGQVPTSFNGQTVWTNVTSIIPSGITNAYGTNFPNGRFSNQTLAYPTNFDIAGGSNFLFALQTTLSNWFQVSKVSQTNGSSYGETATNLTIKGSVAFGPSGQATNIVDGGTNLVKFIGAGTSIATNGVFYWVPAQNCYTNSVIGAVWTNTGTGWNMITNGQTLYSLSGSSPYGATSTGVGGAPSPLSVPTVYLDHNGILDTGFISTTNILVISNSVVTNLIQIATNNYFANNGGYATNGRIYNTRLLADFSEKSIAANGAGQEIDFASAAFGQANTNSSSGFGAAILSGATNNLSLDGAGLIAGGMFNTLGGGSGNADVIVGGARNTVVGIGGIGAIGGNFIGAGLSNRIGTSFFSVVAGGYLNSVNGSYSSIIGGLANTNVTDGGIILGGRSNRVNGLWSIVAGRNVNVTHDNVFSWSDGTPDNSTTNSQARFASTNGSNFKGPLWLDAANTNSGIFYKSNQFSTWAVTNNLSVGDFWRGNSNGFPIQVWNSNGVMVFKNLWP